MIIDKIFHNTLKICILQILILYFKVTDFSQIDSIQIYCLKIKSSEQATAVAVILVSL